MKTAVAAAILLILFAGGYIAGKYYLKIKPVKDKIEKLDEKLEKAKQQESLLNKTIDSLTAIRKDRENDVNKAAGNLTESKRIKNAEVMKQNEQAVKENEKVLDKTKQQLSEKHEELKTVKDSINRWTAQKTELEEELKTK